MNPRKTPQSTAILSSTDYVGGGLTFSGELSINKKPPIPST